MNKQTFESIIRELDTIKDLTTYLSDREKLLLEYNDRTLNCSEQDLLAYYLMNAREFPTTFSEVSFGDWTNQCKGKWSQYLSNRSTFLKKLADKKSYFIDELVKNDVLHVENGELIAKKLMSLSRFERRVRTENLFDMVNKYQYTTNDFSRRHFLTDNGTLFLFVYYSRKYQSQEVDDNLIHAAELYGYKFKPKRIIWLAGSEELKQWKFGVLLLENGEMDNLTGEQKQFYENVIQECGWFTSLQATNVEYKEYSDEE